MMILEAKEATMEATADVFGGNCKCGFWGCYNNRGFGGGHRRGGFGEYGGFGDRGDMDGMAIRYLYK